MPAPRKLAIVAAFFTLCVVWSSTWLAIKIGLRDLPPISYAAIRFLIAIVVLLAVSIGRARLLPRNRTEYIILAWTGVLMFTVNYGLLFWGELHVSSGLAAVLQATIPIFGMVFAHLMLPSEPLRWQRLAGAFVALAGVAVICARLLDFSGPMAFWGGLGIVVGAAGAAYSNVLLKQRPIQLGPAMIAAWQMIFGTVPLLLIGWTVEGNPARFHWTAMSIFCLLYLADRRLGPDIYPSLLAAAANVGDQSANYLSHHASRCGHARLAGGRRNISTLVASGRVLSCSRGSG